MRFKLIYLLFFLFCIVYPNKSLAGPITIRHIVSLLTLAMCYYEGFRSDKYLYLYYGFILLFAISSIATGFAGDFFRTLFGTYISMIAAYAATYILIKKFDGENLLVWTVVCIGVLNAVVTIGQFFEWGVTDNLCSILRVEIDDKYVSIIESQESESNSLSLPGLLSSLNNGYFLSATALLTLYNKKSNFYINSLLWLVIIAASFLAQERAGFMVAVVFSAFIVGDYYFSKSKTAGFFALVIILIVIASVGYSFMDDILTSELRYAKGLEGDARGEYRNITWNYISHNPMGGFFDFDAGGHKHPHNFFLNAFLFGGIIGGICLIVLMFLQILKIVPYLFRIKESEESKWAFIWGLMYIDYTINSMVHNPSIAQGVVPFFIWWGAFLAYSELNEEKQFPGLVSDVK